MIVSGNACVCVCVKCEAAVQAPNGQESAEECNVIVHFLFRIILGRFFPRPC